MHDLLHELSRHVSADQWSNTSGVYLKNEQKLKECMLEKDEHLLDWCRSNYFRTLILNRYAALAEPAKLLNSWVDSMRCLRVLDFARTSIQDLPESVGELKQLRYLNLSYTGIRKLPDTVFTLYNLIHLNLHECEHLGEIPTSVTQLINLGQFILSGCKALGEIPKSITKLRNLRQLEVKEDLIASIPGIGRMTSLENLERFDVSIRDGFKITELEDMNALQGKIFLRGLENVVSGEEAVSANLKSKTYLTELLLEWKRTSEEYDNNEIVRLDEEVLNGLHPPRGLQMLSIRGNAGLQTPEWLLIEPGFFSNLTHFSLSDVDCSSCISPKSLRLEGLVSLKSLSVDTPLRRPLTLQLFDLKALEWVDLTNCSGLRLLELRGLVFLRKLVIWGCRSLRHRTIFDWPQLNTSLTIDGAYCPPALEKLHISDADQLQILDLCGLSSLQSLKIERCPALATFPLHGLSALETLEISDCEGLESFDFEGRTSPNCIQPGEQYEGSSEPPPTIAHIPATQICSSSRTSFLRNCEELLPEDYEDILGRAESRVSYTSKKELFDILCNSILLDHGRASFSLDRSTGKKCYMISSRSLSVTWSIDNRYWAFRSNYSGSRFAEVLELLQVCWFSIYGSINTSALSSETIYAVYLVYKLQPNTRGFKGVPLKVSLKMEDEDAKIGHDVCLHPQGMDPSDNDNGWKAVALGEFYNSKKDSKTVEVRLWEIVRLHWKSGLIIHGIEFRPWCEHHTRPCCKSLPRSRRMIFEWPQLNASLATAKPPALQETYTSNANQLQLMDVLGRSSLQRMKIERCPALPTFPLHGLSALETLEIHDCERLTSLGFEGLTSLEELRIGGCHKLNNFHGEFPPSSIKRLQISNCRLLEEQYKGIFASRPTTAHSFHMPTGSSSLISSSLNCVDLLPADYKDVLGRAKHPVSYTSKEELFDILCNFLLLDDGNISFSLDRSTGKKCCMISARFLNVTWSNNDQYWAFRSDHSGSRFAEVLELLNVCWLDIFGSVDTSDLSLETIYVAHLVYKLQRVTYGFEDQLLKVSVKVGDDDAKVDNVCLYPRDLQPFVRSGGWKAIALGLFYNGNKESKTVEVRLWETDNLHWKKGLIIQGIEFRPWVV